jgi:xylulose-5-phosphate/fructose-6-phosphate phosphoketolase
LGIRLSVSDREIDGRYWRAANYLTVGQIYLQDNPLIQANLKREHIEPRLLGHWGHGWTNAVSIDTSIRRDHRGPGLVAHAHLEGLYTERFPNVERSRNGMLRPISPSLSFWLL